MKTEIKNSHLENRVDFNFIIVNEHFRSGDDILFFGNDEKIIFIDCPIWFGIGDNLIDIFDLLVFAGLFPSKGIARKNWKRSGKEIPPGFSEFNKIGKKNSTITILNPIGVT